jgi:hypothetical protein
VYIRYIHGHMSISVNKMRMRQNTKDMHVRTKTKTWHVCMHIITRALKAYSHVSLQRHMCIHTPSLACTCTWPFTDSLIRMQAGSHADEGSRNQTSPAHSKPMYCSKHRVANVTNVVDKRCTYPLGMYAVCVLLVWSDFYTYIHVWIHTDYIYIQIIHTYIHTRTYILGYIHTYTHT